MRWATRRHCHVDRAACAWLIRRFLDSDAEFVFVDDPDEVLEAGGEATIWLSRTAAPSHDRGLAERMARAVAEEYRGVERAALAAAAAGGARLRELRRLRRELQRIRGRDHFPPPERAAAEAAVERLAERVAVPE